jgi:hypothetical protein
MIVRRLPTVVLACCVVLGACKKAEIASYRVPKEKAPTTASAPAAPSSSSPNAPSSAPGMANTAVATAADGALTWTAPAHWQAKPASAMRKATFTIPGAGGADGELSITAFPGDVGGELANLNRWRSQLQLPPIDNAQLATAVTRTEANGLKFGVVDLTAPSGGQRLLGAWVAANGDTWFFKLTGPDALLAKEKNAFLQFLSTVKPAKP